nr:MAG TPA: hypothetical protein [Caudoviricetes sp.]
MNLAHLRGARGLKKKSEKGITSTQKTEKLRLKCVIKA